MNDDPPLQHAHLAALRFLSYRPRSKAEVRTRLRRSFPADVVDRVIDDLAYRSLVDDRSFARLWRDNRDSLNPRSAASIKRELISKGIARDLAQSTVDDVDDMDSASQHNGDGVHMSLNVNSLANISEHDDEMFLEAFAAAASHHSGDMSALEREPDLLMGKFEDAFAAHDADDLFRNGEDVFFGSP